MLILSFRRRRRRRNRKIYDFTIYGWCCRYLLPPTASFAHIFVLFFSFPKHSTERSLSMATDSSTQVTESESIHVHSMDGYVAKAEYIDEAHTYTHRRRIN